MSIGGYSEDMATRFRKIRRQRGSRYCGWGQIGQHRQSGSRGGIGQAGLHKHFWIRTIKEDANHFGHDSLMSLGSGVTKWLNIKDLDSIFDKYGKTENGNSVIDLTSLGYQKLLGTGKIQSPYIVKVKFISNNAKQKILDMGGQVVNNE